MFRCLSCFKLLRMAPKSLARVGHPASPFIAEGESSGLQESTEGERTEGKRNSPGGSSRSRDLMTPSSQYASVASRVRQSIPPERSIPSGELRA